MERVSQRLRLWGRGVGLLALCNGAIEVSFTPHLPWLARHLGISLGTLGSALSGLPIGLLIGAPLGGLLCKKVLSSRTVAIGGGVLFFAGLPFTVLAPSATGLFLTLACVGAANGLLDAAWQLQSIAYANARSGRQRHLATSAMFSVGSVLGVLVAAAALQLGIPPLAHLIAVAVVTVVTTAVLARHLPSAPDREVSPTTPSAKPVRVDSRRAVFVALCVAAFLAFFPLGAAYSWSSTQLADLGAQHGVIVGGLLAYTVCEGLGRRIAFSWSDRISPVVIVVLGALVALTGGLLVVLGGSVELVVIGWGLVALGISPAGPTWSAAAYNSSQVGSRAMRTSILSSVGYFGSAIGLPVIGWFAQIWGVQVALGLVALSTALMLLLAPAARAARPLQES